MATAAGIRSLVAAGDRDAAAAAAGRRQILDSLAELIWAPLLAALAGRGELPARWREIVRAALFCCPLLVTNLMSLARPALVRLLGLAQAVCVGSEPEDGTDELTRMLDAVTPA